LKEKDFSQVIDYLNRAIEIGIKIQEYSGKSLKKFVDEFDNCNELKELKNEITNFAKQFEFYTP